MDRLAGIEPGQGARVTLVGLNSQHVHAALAPWCLLSGLKTHAALPHLARVTEGTVNEPPRAVLERIVDTAPQVVGICCYIWNIRYVEGLLPALRLALPQAAIVLGGPEVSHRAAEVLARFPEMDCLIAGEGELPFARLMDALCGAGELADVPGLCYRGARGPVVSPPHQHPGMEESPVTAEYVAALQGRIAYLETSRGCPYACAFCLSGRGEKLRQSPLSRAFEDILRLANSGSRTIKFVDRTFNADRARAVQILAFILERHGSDIPEGLTFHFEIAGDLLDEAALALVARAPKGLFQFEIGLQSMDETTLQLVRRRTDMRKLTRQVARLIACGRAHVHLDLIAGLPGEDLAAFARGFDAAYALGPQALQLGFLKLIHGSAMREQPAQYPCGFDPEAPYQVKETPWLSKADFDTLQTVERALDRLHNSGRFGLTLAHLTGPAGLSPFRLFLELGALIRRAEGEGGSLPLDTLSNLVAEHLFLTRPGEAALLRDLLLQDRLATVKTSVLPASLKRPETRYHRAKRALDKRFPRQGAGPRALGFLYAGEAVEVVWCDYAARDPVSGRYPLHRLPLQELPG